MFPLFSKCIFCGRELPPIDQRKKGDHIIPDSLGGSVTTKDVCSTLTNDSEIRCNSRLGAEVDPLIFKDPRVVNAIQELGDDRFLEKIKERATIIGKDSKDGHEIYFKHKKIPKMVPKPIAKNGMEMGEEDAKKYILTELEKNLPSSMPPEVAKRIFCKYVWPKYLDIKIGQEIHAPGLELTLRKRNVPEMTYHYRLSNNAGHRLIAKIVYETCCHFLTIWLPDCLDLVQDDLNYFGAFAFGEQIEVEGRFFHRGDDDIVKSDYIHGITIWFNDWVILVDVDLFQSVNYRVSLTPKAKISLPQINNRPALGFGIAMSFFPGKPKEKWCGILYENEKKWIEYDFPFD